MYKFDHIHVLTLKGVCLDGGPAPYIIMPFMANGSLLAYLKQNRENLVLSLDDTDTQDVTIIMLSFQHGTVMNCNISFRLKLCVNN